MQSWMRNQITWVRIGVPIALVAALIAPGSAGAEHPDPDHLKPQVDSSLVSYAPVSTVSGHMTIAGSDTMQPILTKLALEFRRRHPDMKIAIQGSRNHGESTVQPLIDALVNGQANSRRGDGKTSGHFGSNDVQVLASSRLLTTEEITEFTRRHGYEPTVVPIAQDAVAVYVHRDNPVQGLTLQQADAIFSATRKRGAPDDMTTWGQVGLSDSWQDAPIHLYGRDLRSRGTLPFFKHVVMLDGEFKPTVSLQPGSASVVLAISNDPLAIGYSGIGFQASLVRALPLAHTPYSPYVAPSREAVMSGTYPLIRPLYLYVNKDPDATLDPKILEFLKFVNSREGQTAVAETGVFPLSGKQVAENLHVVGASPMNAAILEGSRRSANN